MIYEINGDKLKLWFVDGGGDRPTEFKGDESKGQVFAIFQRETDQDMVKAFKEDLAKRTNNAAGPGVQRSANNLKQIGLAMHNYHAAYAHLPPRAVFANDKSGKALLSWRVLILPFIEQDNLFRQFHLD